MYMNVYSEISDNAILWERGFHTTRVWNCDSTSIELL